MKRTIKPHPCGATYVHEDDVRRVERDLQCRITELEDRCDALDRSNDEARRAETDCRQIIDTYVSEVDSLRAELEKKKP